MLCLLPAVSRWAVAVLTVAIALGAALPAPAEGAVHPGSLTVRADGRAPVENGRADSAFQQSLEEAFRRGLLEALRGIAPERQSPRDLEIWQETILARSSEFIASWRIVAQEQGNGFLRLSAEIEIWRDKLATAARASRAAAAPPIRVLVLADPLPVAEPTADEELDAGRTATAAIEAELARRGAVILSTSNRAPWLQSEGPSSEENRVSLAAAEGKRLEADGVLLVQLSPRGAGGFILTAHLIAALSEATLATARIELAVTEGAALAEAFAPAARQIATALQPRLPAARSGRSGFVLP